MFEEQNCFGRSDTSTHKGNLYIKDYNVIISCLTYMFVHLNSKKDKE